MGVELVDRKSSPRGGLQAPRAPSSSAGSASGDPSENESDFDEEDEEDDYGDAVMSDVCFFCF